MESKLAHEKISDQVAFQRAARDKEASTDYANPNPFLSPMKRKRSSIIGGLFGKNPKALPKQRRSPILPGQDPFARKNPIKSKPKSKKSDALGRVSLETAQFMAHAGGKRRTKKRRKKRKTKKRRRRGGTATWFKSQAEKDHEKSEKFREAAKRKAEKKRLEKQPPEIPPMPKTIPGELKYNRPKLAHSKGSRKLIGGKKRRRKRKTKKRRRR